MREALGHVNVQLSEAVPENVHSEIVLVVVEIAKEVATLVDANDGNFNIALE